MNTNRIPFGAEHGATYDGYECPSCGALRGQYHDGDCEVERCACCGRQRLTCHCWLSDAQIEADYDTEDIDELPIDEW